MSRYHVVDTWQGGQIVQESNRKPRGTAKSSYKAPWVTRQVKANIYSSVACFFVIVVVCVSINYPL